MIEHMFSPAYDPYDEHHDPAGLTGTPSTSRNRRSTTARERIASCQRVAATEERMRVGEARLEEMRARWLVEEEARELLGEDPVPQEAERPSQLTTAVKEAASAVAKLDWSVVIDDDARDAVIVLEEARRSVTAALGTGLFHLEHCSNTGAATGLPAHRWLARHTRGKAATAKRCTQAGRVLTLFSRFGEAIRSGELSDDHALALQAAASPRIIDALIEAEDTLIELARTSTYPQFCRGLRAIASLLDTDGAEPDCRDRDTLSRSTSDDGTLHIRASFTGHQAVTIGHALSQETDRQFRIARSENEECGTAAPTNAVLRARALAELVRRGQATNSAGSTAPRTDAIIAVTAQDDMLPLADGQPLDPRAAATLTCDARLHPVVLSGAGDILWSGRTRRYVPPPLRRALVVRDGGCIFPGCGAEPDWCDAHHVTPWEDGGATDPTNTCLLCRAHHGLAHSALWKLTAEVDPDSAHVEFWWTTPDGRRLAAEHAAA